MTAETTLKLAEIENIVAIKEASSKREQILEIVRNAPEGFSVFSGNDDETLDLMRGGAAGVIKAVDSATTDCQPNENVEALRVFMLNKKVECRPVWKPMHKQPVYKDVPAYVNGVSESIFKIGFCLPAGPYVSDDDVRYIVECIKEAIAR